MGKFCKDCQFWLFAYESLGEKFGTCDNPLMECAVQIDKESDDEFVIHTEAYFGCIHFTPVHGNVVTKLPKI